MHARTKPAFLPGLDAGPVPADESHLPAAFGKALGANDPKSHLDALRLSHPRPDKKHTGDAARDRKGGPAMAKTEIPRSGHR